MLLSLQWHGPSAMCLPERHALTCVSTVANLIEIMRTVVPGKNCLHSQHCSASLRIPHSRPIQSLRGVPTFPPACFHRLPRQQQNLRTSQSNAVIVRASSALPNATETAKPIFHEAIRRSLAFFEAACIFCSLYLQAAHLQGAVTFLKGEQPIHASVYASTLLLV